MSGIDVAQLATDVTPWVVSAAGAYGVAVLARTQEQAADATIEWGRRVALRVFGAREDSEPLPEVLADVVDDPGDPDGVAALRKTIRKALAADPEFTTELAALARAMKAEMTNTSHGQSHQFNIGQQNNHGSGLFIGRDNYGEIASPGGS